MANYENTPYVVDANTIEVCTNTAELIAEEGASAKSVKNGTFVKVAELEEAGIEVSGSTETWTAFGNGGWQSALRTGIAAKIALKGKRIIGDAGNDAICEKQYAVGADAYLGVRITHPNGDKLVFLCVCDVKVAGDSGKATDVAPFEAECSTHGKPEFEPHI